MGIERSNLFLVRLRSSSVFVCVLYIHWEQTTSDIQVNLNVTPTFYVRKLSKEKKILFSIFSNVYFQISKQ